VSYTECRFITPAEVQLWWNWLKV